MNHLFINGKTFEECRMAAEAKERAQKVHNGEHWDELKACSESDGIVICEGPAKVVYHPPVANVEKLTAAARSKEILVNVPKLNQKEIEEMTKSTSILGAMEEAIKQLDSNELKQVVEIGADTLKARFEEKKANEERHLNHHFYTRADEYRELERRNQILKGAAKYPEPFNPDNFTPKQLIQHAMQENVDQAHYMYGLYEKIEQMENLEKYYEQEKELRKAAENQIKHLQVCKESYKEQFELVGKLTKFLVTEFPEAGNAGELSVDVAIELLKSFRNKFEESESYHANVRRSNAEMVTELNSLAKYLIVHYPNMCNVGHKTTEAAKVIMDAYRNGGGINAKG